jgi:hypothetical protein
MKSYLQKLKTKLRRSHVSGLWVGAVMNKPLALGVALLFAVLGVYFIFTSRAASYAVPSTIPADCSRDVTADLNNFIASVPNGTSSNPNIINFPAGACYRVDGVAGTAYGSTAPAGNQRQHLTLEGNGATLDRSRNSISSYPHSQNFPIMSFYRGSDITVRGFIMRGNHDGSVVAGPCNLDANGNCRDGGFQGVYEYHHGIIFIGTDNSQVLNNQIYNVFGDGVSLCCDSNNITVTGNTIDGIGRMGVGLYWNDGVTITDNVFDRISYHAFDLENERDAGMDILAPLKNLRIERNTIKRHYFALIGASNGFCDGRDNITINANTMTVGGATTYPPIWIGGACPQGGSNVVITGNTLVRRDGSAGNATVGYDRNASVFIDTVVGAKVEGNRIVQGRTDVPTVRFEGSTGILSVKQNDMRENSYLYWLNGTIDGPGVDACGNTTSAGSNRPVACAGSDTTAPTVSLTAPASGSTVSGTVNLAAAASDNVGVARVEFYAGTTLLGSDTTAPYEYGWNTTTVPNGSHSLTAKAVDAAGNSTTSSAVTVTVVNSTTGSCNCLWPDVPSGTSLVTEGAITVGTKFRAAKDGSITAVRWYNGGTATGTHTGTLWSSSGQKLAETVFSNETASGWQQANLSTPVAITANTLYIVSMHTTDGAHWRNLNYFTTSRTNGDLTAPASAEVGGNGVFSFGSAPAFPTSSWSDASYWVDVVFSGAATKQGDLNGDGAVNIFDLSILLSSYNTTNANADINKDGTVNIFDLSILLSNYGK